MWGGFTEFLLLINCAANIPWFAIKSELCLVCMRVSKFRKINVMQNHQKGHDEMDHMPQTVMTTKALAVLLKSCRILTHFSGATNSQRMRVNWGLIGSGARPRMWRHGHCRLLLMVRSTCPQLKTLFEKLETIGLPKQPHTPNPESPGGNVFIFWSPRPLSFCSAASSSSLVERPNLIILAANLHWFLPQHTIALHHLFLKISETQSSPLR